LQNIIESHRRLEYKGKGETHYNWQGGKVGLRRIRLSWQYREMREQVLKRDNYKCVICGCDDRKKLRLDHIKPFELHLELALDPNNCRILCKSCDFKYGYNHNRGRKWWGKNANYKK
jgi:5-methylcytosine-specific restriction endonuclease McrA